MNQFRWSYNLHRFLPLSVLLCVDWEVCLGREDWHRVADSGPRNFACAVSECGFRLLQRRRVHHEGLQRHEPGSATRQRTAPILPCCVQSDVHIVEHHLTDDGLCMCARACLRLHGTRSEITAYYWTLCIQSYRVNKMERRQCCSCTAGLRCICWLGPCQRATKPPQQ